MGYPRVKFNVRDYSVSDEHPEMARHQHVPDFARLKLYYIHVMVVLPLYGVFGMPYITSAFRDPQLNAAVGSKSRQHMAGEAIDFEWPKWDRGVVEAMRFIEDEMYHQTGWCYLKTVPKKKEFKHIHWALPLSPDQPPRKNPHKFWWFDGKNFHPDPPEGSRGWCSQN